MAWPFELFFCLFVHFECILGVSYKDFPDEVAKKCEMKLSAPWNLGKKNLHAHWCDIYIPAFYGQARKLFISCEVCIFSLFIFHFLGTEIRENYPFQHCFNVIFLKGGRPVIHRLLMLVVYVPASLQTILWLVRCLDTNIFI